MRDLIKTYGSGHIGLKTWRLSNFQVFHIGTGDALSMKMCESLQSDTSYKLVKIPVEYVGTIPGSHL